VDLGLPFSSFYINNSNTKIFKQSHVAEFLEIYGNRIKKLKVHHHGSFYSDHEYNFMAGLGSLEELELEEIDATGRIREPPPGVPLPRFPENFARLKVLKPGRIITKGKEFIVSWVLKGNAEPVV